MALNQAPPPRAKTRAGQQWVDLAARGSLRDGVRAKRICGGSRSARRRAAADIAELHH